MSSLPEFTMRIAKKAHLSEEGAGINSIIVIMRPYAHLEKELRAAFKGQEDVKVILDKRHGERRRRRQAVAIECRKADRRRPKEELIEVIFST
ncbi:MAG: hypothetical protein GQ476_02105 [Candidatus Aminicenantes bacterium]|nr:hypothetical protein [Candidatus Aminicenantes bacterium]